MDPVEIDRLHGLRTVLDQAGYESKAVRDRVGDGDWLDQQVGRLRLTDSPLDVLVRLFALGEPVAIDAIEPSALEVMEPLELVRRRDGLVEPLVAIATYGALRLLGDVEVDEAQQAADHVRALSFSSAICDQLTIRATVAVALDLGCGSGVQALLAAANADRVIAVDVNARACAFTRRNAVLNGCSNIEVREGSWFEVVEGDRFDLIVANIPFVISAARRWLHRDSDIEGDGLTASIAGDLVPHLGAGGFATMTASWFDGAPISKWVGPGADVGVVTARSLDPLAHAVVWGGEPIGARRIHEGAFVVRRREHDGSSMHHAALSAPHAGRAADHVRAMFAASGELAALDDAALLESSIALAEWTVVREVLQLVDGEVVITGARIEATTGLDVGVPLDDLTLELVRRLDGAAPFGQCLAEMASDLELDHGLSAPMLRAVRELLAVALLARRPDA
ncbi:MAG: hypothetical protein QOE63_2116 [Acidimicrobiaceae bacterium]